MENTIQNQLYKFSTDLPLEMHSETRCAAPHQTMREELKKLSMPNSNRYSSNNPTAIGGSKPPRLEMISKTTQSSSARSSNENVDEISSTNNTLVGLTSGVNSGPNRAINPPRLNPIGGSFDSNIRTATSYGGSTQNGDVNSNDIMSPNRSASTASQLTRSVSLNISDHQRQQQQQQQQQVHYFDQSFDNVTPESDQSVVNHTTSSFVNQDSINSYSNELQSELQANYYINTCSEQNCNWQTTASDGSANQENVEPALNSVYTFQNVSLGYLEQNLIDVGGFHVDFQNSDAVVASNSTKNNLNYSTSAIGSNPNFVINSNVNDSNGASGVANLNDSAAYGDDSILTMPTSLSAGGIPFDFNTAASVRSANNFFDVNHNEYFDMMGSFNSSDPNGMFGTGSMISNHFQQRPPGHTANDLVIARPPGSGSNVPVSNVIPNQQQDSYHRYSNYHNNASNHSTTPLDDFNAFNPFDALSNNGAFISSNGFAFLSNGNTSRRQIDENSRSSRSRRSRCPSQRKSSSSRRRSDVNDPQSVYKRQNHNMLERKRRSELRGYFFKLVSLVPELVNMQLNRLSKVKILTATSNYALMINAMKKNLTRLKSDKHRLVNAVKEKINYLVSINQYTPPNSPAE